MLACIICKIQHLKQQHHTSPCGKKEKEKKEEEGRSDGQTDKKNEMKEVVAGHGEGANGQELLKKLLRNLVERRR